MVKLEWRTEQRKVNDLLPLEINPRKISDAKKQELLKSLERFNLVDIPVINADGKLISGHQRCKVLQMADRGDEMIDVRLPNRMLTLKEVKEYNLISNTHSVAAVVANLVEFLVNGSIHYICMDWRHMKEVLTAGEIYTEMKNLVVWNKDNGGMGSFYRSKHELIFVYKNGNEKHINNFLLGQGGRYRTNVWDYPIASSFAAWKNVGGERQSNDEMKMHPTVKPLKLVSDAVLDCSEEGQIILDLFIGSGTTIAASHQNNRIGYGMELDPKYCQTTIDRMKKLFPGIEVKKLN